MRPSASTEGQAVPAPFPRRWLYYVVAKFVVLGAVGALVLRFYGIW